MPLRWRSKPRFDVPRPASGSMPARSCHPTTQSQRRRSYSRYARSWHPVCNSMRCRTIWLKAGTETITSSYLQTKRHRSLRAPADSTRRFPASQSWGSEVGKISSSEMKPGQLSRSPAFRWTRVTLHLSIFRFRMTWSLIRDSLERSNG